MTSFKLSPPRIKAGQPGKSTDRTAHTGKRISPAVRPSLLFPSERFGDDADSHVFHLPDDDYLLNTDEVARMLDIDRSTLATWRMNNRVKIPYCRIGATIKYRRSDVIAFIESQRVDPQTEKSK